MGKKSIKKLEKQLKKAKKQEKKAKKQAHMSSQTVHNSQNALIEVSTPQTVSNPIARLMPQDTGSLMTFATMMSKGQDMIGKPFRGNAGACAGVTLQAIRWGMDPFALSLEAYLVNGTMGYSGKIIAGVVNTHPLLAKRLRYTYEGEASEPVKVGNTWRRNGDLRVVVTGYLVGEDEPFIYKSPEIKDIKIQNSPLWAADPEQQLKYYGARNWARAYVPEIMAGIISHEEATVHADLNKPEKTNTQKRIEKMNEAKAKAKAKDEAEDIIDAEVIEEQTADEVVQTKDADVEEPGEEPVEENMTDPQSSSGETTDAALSPEALDWIEALSVFSSETEMVDNWDEQKKQQWWKNAKENERNTIIEANKSFIDNLKGEN